MQEVLNERDRIREEIEVLDGGYATIARILKQSDVSILKALKPSNRPRLKTLEKIQGALDKAQKVQKKRIAGLRA